MLRWCGSKRQLVTPIVNLMREATPYWHADDGYYEPFLGSGAVFFELCRQIGELPTKPWARLSDTNAALMAFWETVRDAPTDLAEEIAKLAREYAAASGSEGQRWLYQRERDAWNARGSSDDTKLEQAARFLFLNRTCFNGLWRTSKEGRFNVPFGKLVKPAFPAPIRIAVSSGLLQGARLTACSYADVKPPNGSLVYVDPPYPGTFTSYNGTAWTNDDHRRLAEWCKATSDAGAAVIVSQPDCSLSRGLYDNWRHAEVSVRRSVGGKGAKRGAAKELLFFR